MPRESVPIPPGGAAPRRNRSNRVVVTGGFRDMLGSMERVLVVNSRSEALSSVEHLLFDRDYRVSLAPSLDAAVQAVAELTPDLAILGLPLPGHDSISSLSALRAVEPKLPVVVVSGDGGTDEAIEMIKAGAFDYLLEPLQAEDLLVAVSQGLEAGRLMRSPVAIASETRTTAGDALVGRSKPMQEIYKAIGRVAPTDSTVLLRGASGTGKELVARAIYQHSSRADRPFVVVNCVAIPETLLESELFGFERGAFTGAIQRRIGKVEQADGGTLFLDEIGDVPLPIQAKLLRLLQDRSIERIGGREPIPVDVRILAATNRDLESAIASERFRSDLYYRLNVVPIHLPPLRERLDDVPLLCEYLIERFALGLGVRNPGVTPEACDVLRGHDWPGNVRELANTMEQCLIFSRGRRIGEAEVKRVLIGAVQSDHSWFDDFDEELSRYVRNALADGRTDLLREIQDRVTRDVLQQVLQHTSGNRSRAALLLGISRPTLLAKMRKYGLS